MPVHCRRVRRVLLLSRLPSLSGKKLRTFGAAEAAAHYQSPSNAERFAALEAKLISSGGGNCCEVKQCAQCGFCFADPFVAGDAEFYALAYDRQGGYPQSKWEFTLTYDHLKKLNLGPDAKLLDVGAGDGAFLRTISPSLPPNNVSATEYSEVGLERIRTSGHAGQAMDIRDIQDAQYDVITMFQVLEHLDRVDEVFAAAQRLTKPKAHLFIAVPNDKRIEFSENNGGLLDVPPNHISRWTRPAFEQVAARTGWRSSTTKSKPPQKKTS